ncbi:MAG: hypothetical protein NTW82_04530 [Bacteroidia bacterium]|nr:hypothetical protein [Bacteroidia bacterium]
MKKAALSSILMVTCILALSQVPESFNYQVVVRDGSTNSPLTDQNVSFRMSILKGNSSGESQYSELHSANTGTLGIVNLVIGNGTDKTGDITTIDWGADTYYLKVEVDKTGGESFFEMGTTQLLSVPYALYANKSGLSKDNKAFDSYIKDDFTLIALPKIFVEYPYSLVPAVTDEDWNTYSTVKIGTQIWMAENLRTTKYNDGSDIPNLTSSDDWILEDGTTGMMEHIVGMVMKRLHIKPLAVRCITDMRWLIQENYAPLDGIYLLMKNL